MNERARTLLVSLRHARRAYAFEHGREPTHVALNPVDVLELETAPALSAFAHGSVGERFVAGMSLVEDSEVPTGTLEYADRALAARRSGRRPVVASEQRSKVDTRMGVSLNSEVARGNARSPITVRLKRIDQWSPFLGDARLDRRHRHLGKTAGDERSEGHAERLLLGIAGCAGEYEAQATPRIFHPGCDAGIGWFEAETVPAFEEAHLFGEVTSLGEEVLGVAVDGDASSEASKGVRGQRRRGEQPPCFEVEDRIHGWGCPSGFRVSVTVGARRSPVHFFTCHSSNHNYGSSTYRRERA